jgi:hypothetical protein
MNPFTSLIDWVDENADVAGPLGAFIGLALAITIAVIGAK